MDPIESWMDADAVRRLAGRLIAPVDQPQVVAHEEAGFERGFVGYVVTPGAEPPVSQEPVALPVATEPRTAFEDAVEDDPGPVPPQVTPPVVAETWQAPPAEPAFFPVDGASEVAQVVPDIEEIETPRPFLAATEPTVEAAAHVPTVQPPLPPMAAVPPPAGLEGKLVARLEFFRDWLVSKFDAKGAFILDRDGEPVLDDPPFAKLHFLARSLAQAYRPVKGEPGNVHVKIGSASYLAVIPVETAFGCLVLGAVLPEPIEASAVSLVAHALETASTPTRR